ncbi:MAG: hypothetical protein AB1726_12180 [Planctomycetota bacterium]
MTARDRIPFVAHQVEARLRSPLAGFAEVQSHTEERRDPLTGRAAIVGHNLSGKRGVLYSETDEALLAALAARTAEGCFFCPGRVETVTPRYPADVLAGDGRLRAGGSLLFPNLFPLTEYHAVIALGERHFRPLDEFPAELLAEGLGLAVRFIGEIARGPHAPACWAICANYLPPGGASIIHPHLQVLGSPRPLTTPAIELERARAYRAAHGACYFDDLVAVERERGERLIAEHGPVTWLAAFAPRGNTELLGICAGAAHPTTLTPDHVAGLAAGLAQGLRAYGALRYSTFNLCVYGAPLGADEEAFRVYASLVSRQSVVESYRCDDYFLQKMLGTEIVVDSPEHVAGLVRAAGG